MYCTPGQAVLAEDETVGDWEIEWVHDGAGGAKHTEWYTEGDEEDSDKVRAPTPMSILDVHSAV